MEYAYATGTLGAVVDTVNYGYNNANWGDLLTSYNGKNITYDAIGNPLNDGSWAYTWEHGRQLASMTNGTTTVDYQYNSDGIRTQKTVTTARDHVHFFTHSVSEPTCTENGFTRHSCECGYTYVDSPVPATGHTYTASVVESTCTTKGYTLYTCACGDSYQDGAPGHTFTTLVVEPTETVNGFTLHECECGYRYESDPVVSLGSPDADVIYDVKEYDYIYNGSSLTQLTITTTNYGDGPVVETLYFAYDGSSPMTVTYNGDVFYYVTNLQGDVVAILNDQGTAVVEYTYDAWGNILTATGSMANTLGMANPLTYRGYVYDDESGLYYLKSRYYNPNVGRFINADSIISTGELLGNNAFSYCNNTTVNGCDPCGTCLHRLDFWNDCEECKSKSFKDQVLQLVDDIVSQSNKLLGTIKDLCQSVLPEQTKQVKPIISGIIQPSWQLIEETKEFVVDRFSSLEKASNTLSVIGLVLDIGAAYLGGVAAGLAIPTFGISATTAGTVAAVLAIASLPFHGVALILNILDEE